MALESLYEETGDYPALLDVVKRRAEAAETDAERKQLLFKQAQLCDEKLGDTRAAIAVYEQILEMALDARAIDALERLYAQAERWHDLIALYERQIAAPGTSNERKRRAAPRARRRAREANRTRSTARSTSTPRRWRSTRSTRSRWPRSRR